MQHQRHERGARTARLTHLRQRLLKQPHHATPPSPPARPASDGRRALPTLPSLFFPAWPAALPLPPITLPSIPAPTLASPPSFLPSSYLAAPARDRIASAMAPSLLGGFTKSLAMTTRSPRSGTRPSSPPRYASFSASSSRSLARRARVGRVAADSEELAEVEAELDAAFKSNKGESKTKSKASDDMKKQQRPFLMQFFSPIFLKAFSITFFGEWGDKSQIATIGLAADENPFGVVLGGILYELLLLLIIHSI
ncbi:hypothetical protein PR202_gb03109 [Eleusine coracana subsp. coracana]|uniref:GDT1 family protein n=1 Tax=Eleusine coracana subsp. coracana TaxID=191504 RepID=A0AAV5E0W8_ELECO|nr:hypothetical protein PR202_gb03109 [Eleusine coracana subsp. coracana]